jgi:hypothetical protein
VFDYRVYDVFRFLQLSAVCSAGDVVPTLDSFMQQHF